MSEQVELSNEEQTALVCTYNQTRSGLQYLIVDSLRKLTSLSQNLEKCKGDFVVQVCSDLIASMAYHIEKSGNNSSDEILEVIFDLANDRVVDLKSGPVEKPAMMH